MRDNIRAIKNLEDKYGLMMFRMALTHLVDVGARNMTDENVEEAFKQIRAKDEEVRVNGGFPIMTAEFQCGLVRCAAELAKCSVWDLFYYIKEYVTVSDGYTYEESEV